MHANEHPLPEPGSWREHAACRGMPVADFFPGRCQQKIQAALDTCARCPVQAECLLACIDEEVHISDTEPKGIRGGMTARERRQIVRNRRRLQGAARSAEAGLGVAS